MGKEDKNEIIYPSPCKNSENIDRMIGYVPHMSMPLKLVHVSLRFSTSREPKYMLQRPQSRATLTCGHRHLEGHLVHPHPHPSSPVPSRMPFHS